jgi:RecA-family ATPase
MNSAEFAAKKHPRAWLVEDVLVPGQPCVIGGPPKSLKTTLAIDLAVGLGTGTNFLRQFDVPKRRNVALFSGESAEATI